MERQHFKDECLKQRRPSSGKPQKLRVYLEDDLNGIKREFVKEGKPFAV